MTAAGKTLGLYISIPFCRSKCTYCNFASGVYPASQHGRYVARLVDDLSGASGFAAAHGLDLSRDVDTVYLGGGTPSLLEPELIERIFRTIRSEFDLAPDAEITMECAPGQIADATLDAMIAAGVNRVSLGVQSFVDSEARSSGRLHSRAIVETDVARLRAAGLVNLNLDLIAGLAGQTRSSWRESMAALLALDPPHASIYMLEVDEDSRLGREILDGGARYHAGLVPTDDAIVRMYQEAIQTLAANGLAQYEISNFSRAGFESRHNLRYWLRQPYLGIGLDASSMAALHPAVLWTGEVEEKEPALRWKTTGDLKSYLDGDTSCELRWVSLEQQHEESWFLGLRLNAGVSLAAIEREFGSARTAAALEVVERLISGGLLKQRQGTVRLTARGRLLSNEVFAEFLELGIEANAAIPQ